MAASLEARPIACCGFVWCLLALGAPFPLPAQPLEPDAEQQSFVLADPGLVVELVASEPRVQSPVALAWDEDARLYVAEMRDYPQEAPSGAVRLLDDRDGDGLYETSQEFATGLPTPNGLLCWKGGVFVTAAPDLLYLRDTNGDDVADQRQIVFTGFNAGNQQLRANGLTWGLDGWIYGANGRSDGAIRRPDQPESEAISIRARDFRFFPDGSRFEAIVGQSQFGQCRDDWGNRYLSWNTIPVRKVMFDEADIARDPQLAACAVVNLQPPEDDGRVFPLAGPPKTFNRERTDYFNALCGLTVFRGPGLGHSYSGNALVCESLSCLIHRRKLQRREGRTVAVRAEADREFLASRDPWFHPVYLTTGPDGCLYVADFYRRWVEHPQFVPESQRGSVDWREGEQHGRIWRIRARDYQPPARVRFSQASNAELVAAIDSPNGWQRDTAQRLLCERNGVDAIPALEKLMNGKSPHVAVQALWTIALLEPSRPEAFLKALRDPDDRLQAAALQLAAPHVEQNAEIRAQLASFRPHGDAASTALVRLAAACPMELKLSMLASAVAHGAEDWATRALLAGSAGSDSAEFLLRLMSHRDIDGHDGKVPLAHFQWSEASRAMIFRRLGEQIGRENSSEEEIAKTIALSEHADASVETRLAVVDGLLTGAGVRATDWKQPKKLPGALTTLFPRLERLRKEAIELTKAESDSTADIGLDLLERIGTPAEARALKSVIDSTRSAERSIRATQTIVYLADDALAEEVLEEFDRLSRDRRRALLSAAIVVSAWQPRLVAALEEGRIAAAEFDPAQQEVLRTSGDETLASRAASAFGAAISADRAAIVDRFLPAAQLHGSAERGLELFRTHCSGCHKVGGVGRRVGPELSGVGVRPREALVADLMNPNAQVSPDYLAYVVATTNGQVLTGVIAAESGGAVALRTSDGMELSVPRSEIESLRPTGKSLMPEGFEQHLSVAQVADLLAFLGSGAPGQAAP